MMGIQNREPHWKRAWPFFTKWNLCLLHNAVISLLGIYPRETETYVPIKIYTWICVADLVVTAKSWKPPRYPSAGEWLNKLGYTHTTEYSSAMKGTDYWFIQLGWTSRKFCRVKKPISKHYILYDSVYIAFLKWHSYRGREQISNC